MASTTKSPHQDRDDKRDLLSKLKEALDAHLGPVTVMGNLVIAVGGLLAAWQSQRVLVIGACVIALLIFGAILSTRQSKVLSLGGRAVLVAIPVACMVLLGPIAYEYFSPSSDTRIVIAHFAGDGENNVSNEIYETVNGIVSKHATSARSPIIVPNPLEIALTHDDAEATAAHEKASVLIYGTVTHFDATFIYPTVLFHDKVVFEDAPLNVSTALDRIKVSGVDRFDSEITCLTDALMASSDYQSNLYAAAAKEYTDAITIQSTKRLGTGDCAVPLHFLYSGRAAARANDGRIASAAEDYRRAIDLDPNDSFAHFGLGAALENSFGRLDQAETEFSRAASGYEQLPARVELLRIEMLRDLKKRAEAHAELVQVADYNDAGTPSDKFAIGVACYVVGRYPCAQREIQESVDARPYPQRAIALATAYEAGGDWDKALSVLQNARSQNVDNDLVEYELAKAYEAIGNWTSACGFFSALAQVDEKRVCRSSDVRGVACPQRANNGSFADDHDTVRRMALSEIGMDACAITFYGGNASRANGEQLMLDGDFAASENRFGDAITIYRRVIQNEPANLRALVSEATALEAMHKPARSTFEEAVTIVPYNSEERLLHAQALRELGDVQRSNAELTALIQDNPEDVDARIARARLESDRGRYSDARSDLSFATQHRPDNYAAWLDLSRVDYEAKDTKRGDDSAGVAQALCQQTHLRDCYAMLASLARTFPHRKLTNPIYRLDPPR